MCLSDTLVTCDMNRDVTSFTLRSSTTQRDKLELEHVLGLTLLFQERELRQDHIQTLENVRFVILKV